MKNYFITIIAVAITSFANAQNWSLTGNSGTTSTNFLGTSDNAPLKFRVNNLPAGEINPLTNNTSLGVNALASSTTGWYNTAMGENALALNTSGSLNTAMGENALASNTNSSYNTAQGEKALFLNAKGNSNTAQGYQALYSNKGDYNTAVGRAALVFNTTGYNNSAQGKDALFSNTTGHNNTAQGKDAIHNNIIGDNNSGIGVSALYNNTSGSSNTAQGNQSLYSNTSGWYNTAMGESALYHNITGNYNTALGFNADVIPNEKIILNNATAIGFGAIVDASDKVRIGNTTVTSISGAVNFTKLSDGRFKKEVKENVEGLAFINKLRPVTYIVDVPGIDNFYDQGRKSASGTEDAQLQKMKQASYEYAAKHRESGFIAQEVEKITKESGFDFSGVDVPTNPNALYGIRYAEFVVPLVKAVQEQQIIIEQQSNKTKKLEDRITELERLISSILPQSSMSVDPTATSNPNTIKKESTLPAKVYPNPTQSELNIETFVSQKGALNTQITDPSGRIIYSEKEEAAAGLYQKKIQIRDYSSGVYYLKITDTSGKQTTRFVKE